MKSEEIKLLVEEVVENEVSELKEELELEKATIDEKVEKGILHLKRELDFEQSKRDDEKDKKFTRRLAVLGLLIPIVTFIVGGLSGWSLNLSEESSQLKVSTNVFAENKRRDTELEGEVGKAFFKN